MIVAGDGIIIVSVSFVGRVLIVEGEVIRRNTVAPRPSQESGFTRSKDKPGDKKTRFQGCKLNTRLTGLVELKRKFDAGQTQQSTATMTTPDVTDWFLIQNKNVWGLDSCSEEHSTPHLDLLTDVQDVGDHAPEFQFGNSTTEIPKKMG